MLYGGETWWGGIDKIGGGVLRGNNWKITERAASSLGLSQTEARRQDTRGFGQWLKSDPLAPGNAYPGLRTDGHLHRSCDSSSQVFGLWLLSVLSAGTVSPVPVACRGRRSPDVPCLFPCRPGSPVPGRRRVAQRAPGLRRPRSQAEPHSGRELGETASRVGGSSKPASRHQNGG